MAGRHGQQPLNLCHHHGAPVGLRRNGEVSQGVQWIGRRQILALDTPVTESRQGLHVGFHLSRFFSEALPMTVKRPYDH